MDLTLPVSKRSQYQAPGEPVSAHLDDIQASLGWIDRYAALMCSASESCKTTADTLRQQIRILNEVIAATSKDSEQDPCQILSDAVLASIGVVPPRISQPVDGVVQGQATVRSERRVPCLNQARTASTASSCLDGEDWEQEVPLFSSPVSYGSLEGDQVPSIRTARLGVIVSPGHERPLTATSETGGSTNTLYYAPTPPLRHKTRRSVSVSGAINSR